MLGCGSSTGNRSETVAPPPFVFRKLELEQKKTSGDIDWKLSSPEARYELSRRLVRAKKPVGILYNNNKPSFEIRADFAVVVNDGEQVILEGDVQLQQINGQQILIKGERLRWQPQLSRLVMEQQPRAFDDRSRITATFAVLRQDTSDLTLSGPVQLDHWKGKLALTFPFNWITGKASSRSLSNQIQLSEQGKHSGTLKVAHLKRMDQFLANVVIKRALSSSN